MAHAKNLDPGRLLRVTFAFLLAFLIIPLVPSAADAATAKSGEWKYLTIPGGGSGDSFYNYDFSSETLSSTHVDWAVDIIFTDNATVNKTSGPWSSFNPHWVRGSVAYGYVKGGWDSNEGLKQYSNGTCNSHGHNFHYRVYAPSSTDRMYSTNFGYFVIATAHDDYAENCTDGTAWTGNSEGAESYIVGIFNESGYSVVSNYFNLGNAQTNTEAGTVPHKWDNNGMASQIFLP